MVIWSLIRPTRARSFWMFRLDYAEAWARRSPTCSTANSTSRWRAVQAPSRPSVLLQEQLLHLLVEGAPALRLFLRQLRLPLLRLRLRLVRLPRLALRLRLDSRDSAVPR